MEAQLYNSLERIERLAQELIGEHEALQAENAKLRELLRRAKRLRLLVRICNYTEPHLAEYALAKKAVIEIEAAIDAALKGA